jgi:hypothetical protein
LYSNDLFICSAAGWPNDMLSSNYMACFALSLSGADVFTPVPGKTRHKNFNGDGLVLLEINVLFNLRSLRLLQGDVMVHYGSIALLLVDYMAFSLPFNNFL